MMQSVHEHGQEHKRTELPWDTFVKLEFKNGRLF